MSTLLDQPITVAVAAQVSGEFTLPIKEHQAKNLTVQVIFTGTGGTSIDAWLQVSLDAGKTYMDIANVHLLAAGSKALNLSSMTPAAAVTPTDGALAVNTQVDGFVGGRFRVKYTSVGTWANGNLKVDVAQRMIPMGVQNALFN